MLLFLNPTIKTQWKVWLFIQTFHCVFQHIHRRSSSFSALWIYTILKLYYITIYYVFSFTTLWIYTILKQHLAPIVCLDGFTTLWIYTILKLPLKNGDIITGFTTLWIYTILKRFIAANPNKLCFTTLWIYTILKPEVNEFDGQRVSLPYGFTLFSNLFLFWGFNGKFHYLMDLHYSQTGLSPCHAAPGFTTLWIYTILKHVVDAIHVIQSFTTLWIYTILKPATGERCAGHRFTTLWIYTILKRIEPYNTCNNVSLPYGFTLFSNQRRLHCYQK